MKICNPGKFREDENGQWWYRQKNVPPVWLRVYPQKCIECGCDYIPPYRAQKQKSQTCSKSCGFKRMHRANPTKFAKENGGNWKGGRNITKRGYVYVYAPDHPNAVGSQKRYILEHRLVMEHIIGRPLLPHEEVHHKNAIRHDNRPENLELWEKSQPPGARAHEIYRPHPYSFAEFINAELAFCA